MWFLGSSHCHSVQKQNMILVYSGYSQLIYHGDSLPQCFLKLLFAFKSSTDLLFLTFSNIKKRPQLHNSNLKKNMDLIFVMLFFIFLWNNQGQLCDNSKKTVSCCAFIECQENLFYLSLKNTRYTLSLTTDQTNEVKD